MDCGHDPSNAPAPVRGTRRTDLIPHIRKIDLMSSNSYILSGEDQIALIDPGALDEQWDLLVDDMLRLMAQTGHHHIPVSRTRSCARVSHQQYYVPIHPSANQNPKNLHGNGEDLQGQELSGLFLSLYIL